MPFESQIHQPLEGFPQPVHDAQRVFRAVLDAMSHPGKIVTVIDLPDAPHPLHPMTAAICLSLVDFETPIWVDADIAESGQAMSHLRFHCGCPVAADPKEARTVILANAQADIDFKRYSIGTDERPDLSATVIVQVAQLRNGSGVRLSGPGIKFQTELLVEGAGEGLWSAIQENQSLFPRGVDVILSAPDAVACLPRTTQVEV